MGLTAAARRAGTNEATSATPKRSAVIVTKVHASSGSVSYRIWSRNRVSAIAPPTPTASPTAVTAAPCATTDRITRAGGAPSASRTPISRVRSVTAYESTL